MSQSQRSRWKHEPGLDGVTARPSRPQTERVKHPSFAILCFGRVGSEHLVSLLDSHSRITCFGELFAPAGGAGPPRATTHVPRFFESGLDDPWAYWAEVSAGVTGELVGFKLPQSSLKGHPRSGELIEPKEVDLIRLRRANRVAQYVSVLMARDSGVWQSTDGSYLRQPVRVDARRCIKALNRIDRGEAALDRLAGGHRVFELRYEELARGHGVNEVQEFLGVQPQPLTSPYEQMRTLPLEDVIENYDELASALEDTPFAADLRQGHPTGRDR
jgi:hypothetical protein